MNKLTLIVLAVVATAGCAAMDLRVDTVPMSNQFGTVAPRVSAKKCTYYSSDNAPTAGTYVVLAKYVIQEENSVLLNQSAQDMICHAHKKAVEKGADAIIVDDIGTANVSAGGSAKTTPLVKIRAIRFKGEPPVQE